MALKKFYVNPYESLKAESDKCQKLTDLHSAGVTTTEGAAALGEAQVETYMVSS